MKWSAFKSSVFALLGEDAEGLNPITERQIDQGLRSACLKMQQVIESYQTGHETIFEPEDLTEECWSMRGELPTGADLQSLWRYMAENEEDDDPACERKRVELKPVQWSRRMEFIQGTVRDCNAYVADPNSQRFYIVPKLEEGEELHLFWNGLKTDFDEDEELPWGEEAVEAVSHFVNAQIERKSKSKTNEYATFVQDWQKALGLLAATEKKRREHSGR